MYQRLGDALRTVHPSALFTPWVEAIDAGLRDDGRVVVPDVRTPAEVRAVQERGGVVWRVERPRLGDFPGQAHWTEAAIDDERPDVVIRNDSGWAELSAAVDVQLARVSR